MPLVPLALSTQDATLLAAAIAAAAGVLKLLADALSARGQANRAAHRSALEPHLASLGASIHQVMAGVVLVHRRVKQGQEPGNALANAQDAADALRTQRLEVKYSLGGTDEPLRILTRAPNWVSTYKGDSTGDELVEKMQKLAKRLDAVVAKSYRRGRPPTWIERRRLSRTAKQVRASWERRFGKEDDAAVT